MPNGPDKVTVLCADRSADRLRVLERVLQREGFAPVTTQSASECVTISARDHPRFIILDMSLLYVDQANLAEYVVSVSSFSTVILTVDDPRDWQQRSSYIREVCKREDVATISSLLQRL